METEGRLRLAEVFVATIDPRQPGKVEHDLVELQVVVISAVQVGGDTCVEIAFPGAGSKANWRFYISSQVDRRGSEHRATPQVAHRSGFSTACYGAQRLGLGMTFMRLPCVDGKGWHPYNNQSSGVWVGSSVGRAADF